MPTVTILLVLTVSGILNSNFDQMYLMNNSATIEVGEVIDTFVYKFGITNSRYSYATAVSLSKSVVSFILLFGANFAVRRASKRGNTVCLPDAELLYSIGRKADRNNS